MTSFGFGRSPAIKFFVVGVLTLLMVVPIAVIWAVLMERSSRAAEAEADIAQGWGGLQKVAGPFLAVPYTVIEQREEGERTVNVTVRRSALFLPEALEIAATADTEERARGIFKVTVFSAAMDFKGSFEAPSFARLGVTPASIDWDKAVLFLTIADPRGIVTNAGMSFGGGEPARTFSPGLGVDFTSAPGIHVAAPFAAGPRAFDFAFDLALNGTGQILFAPAAKETIVGLESGWEHPSFTGAFLPDARDLERPGFSARWAIPYLRRSLPQETLTPDQVLYPLDQSLFGVRFFKPIDFYVLVDRALKYAILFVGLSFLVFFLSETLTGARVHVVQYVLIGAAQVLFYLLLLSFAEHVGFANAYLAAAGGTVALTTLYALSVLRSTGLSGVVLVALGGLYGLLFLLLREEDYALLIGALAAFVVLAVTMFVTRRVDWYQVGTGPAATAKTESPARETP